MKKQIMIEPSLIGGDLGAINTEVITCQKAGAKSIHLDVMDGLFVPNFTLGPDIVQSVRKTVPEMLLDVHLMIYSPANFVESFIAAGADEITFHLEATEDVEYTIDYIRKCNRKVGLAIKPETSPTLVMPYLELLDKVLVMTVSPGFGGQSFMEDMLEKVRFFAKELQMRQLPTQIQVDGGITEETGKACIAAGATRLVTGSYFFRQEDKAHVIQTLEAYVP